MTPQVFHILLALTPAPRHGYGIIKDISEHTGGRLRLGTGTMYSALQRLLEAGWIEESSARAHEDEDDERRTYYQITDKGRAALKQEAEHMNEAVSLARLRRVLTKGAGTTRR